MVQRSRFCSGIRNLTGVTKELKSLWKREVRWHRTVRVEDPVKSQRRDGVGGRGKEVGDKKEGSFKKVNEKPSMGGDRVGSYAPRSWRGMHDREGPVSLRTRRVL